MSDDGTGAGIRIPSMLIGNYQGQILKKYMLESKEDIVLSFQFIHPRKTKKVKFQIWYPPSNDRSLRFIKNMGEYLKPLVKNIDFEANFITLPCKWCPRHYKNNNCLGDGRYCELAPFSGKEGRTMMMESLK